MIFSEKRLIVMKNCAIIAKLTTNPPVAKLDIAADSDSEGRGFESLRAGQKAQVRL